MQFVTNHARVKEKNNFKIQKSFLHAMHMNYKKQLNSMAGCMGKWPVLWRSLPGTSCYEYEIRILSLNGIVPVYFENIHLQKIANVKVLEAMSENVKSLRSILSPWHEFEVRVSSVTQHFRKRNNKLINPWETKLFQFQEIWGVSKGTRDNNYHQIWLK